MVFQKTFFVVLLAVLVWSCNRTRLNTVSDFEAQANKLIAEMTLEEKVSQLSYNSPAIERLNIPEYNWWNECLHGVGRSGIATVFPQAIGMAAMWDDSTMFEIASIISDEARAKHHEYIKKGKRGIYQGLTFWTPNINIFRDPRWGRGMETYGEDPYLTGKLGVSFIKGLQGNHPKYFKVVATAKHFAVHSGSELNRHRFNATPSQYDFLETYSPQFKMAVKEAKVHSVMCAYNRYNGQPCCGNIDLANILRNDWGFNGYIVSDCWAIRDFYSPNAHEIVNTKTEASAIALKAGTDLNCGNSYPSLVDAVKQKLISEKDIDKSLKRLLITRFKLGMFDENNPYSSIPFNVVNSEKHQQKAIEAARKSMVLLKNKENILPYTKEVKKVAVIGPNANDVNVLLGNYNGYPSNPITPFEGIKNKLQNADVKYAAGCHLADGLPLFTDIPNNIFYTDGTKQKNGLKAEYFNNTKLSGAPSISKIDSNIDFKWWENSPDSTLNKDTFSVRWTGIISPKKSGKYALSLDAFPYAKLWVDDKETFLVKSKHHPKNEYEYFEFEANKNYKIKLEYKQEQTEYPLVQLRWENPNKDIHTEAINLAKKSDLIVLCMGLSPMLEGEEMKVNVEGFSHGDRVDIKLPESQSAFIKTIYNLHKPTILVLLNGSALAFNWEAENIPAILEAWYPGQAGGAAIADVIFGDYNPSGRLPLTFYQSVEQLPAFEDYNMKGKTYRYFKEKPLYEFGYGLSYTTFKYEWVQKPEKLNKDEDLSLAIKVTNTGKYDGDEIVQLYISHPNSKYKVPIRALKGFKRVALKSSESKIIEFNLKQEDISVLNEKNEYIIEEGAINLSIGGKQPDELSIKNNSVITTNIIIK